MSLSSAPSAVWAGLGLAAGLMIAFVWPTEHAAAVAVDRNDKFAIVTAQTSSLDVVEAVFVLDFLTGSLRGVALNNNTGLFNLSYERNVAADFNVDPNAKATYAIVAGRGNLPSRGNIVPAAGVIYVAELNSGQVICYSFPYQAGNRPVPGALPLQPVTNFQFRPPVQ